MQKIISMLLCAVLTVGMSANAVPVNVRAQENEEPQDMVIENIGLQDTAGADTEEPLEVSGGVIPEEQPEELPDKSTGGQVQVLAEENTVSGNAAGYYAVTAAEAPGIEAYEAEDLMDPGKGWTLNESNGTLTIMSDEGMEDWHGFLVKNENYYKKDVVKTVFIADGVKSIVPDAFRLCYYLEKVVIPDSVTSIGKGAFLQCSSLGEVVIPDGVTSIGNSAFSGCRSLKKVVIPDNVTSIGDFLFGDCDRLTEVTIPAGVTSIGEGAFSMCSRLKEVIIPAGVTSIGESAFNRCHALTEVVIPAGVTRIEGSVFFRCTGLTKVTIPANVTSIGENAFNGCAELTGVTIPANVTTIEKGAFSGCVKLTEVTIPTSVTSMADEVFKGCGSLEKVTMQSEVPPTCGNDAFTDCKFVTDNKKAIYVPAGKAATYKTAADKGWPAWKNYIIDEGHTHSLTKHDSVPPTCTATGTGEYWRCEGADGCDGIFSDANAQNEIQAVPILDKVEHNYGTVWQFDDANHWHECGNCGDKTDIAVHAGDSGTITKQPTETEEGTITYRCTECGYEWTGQVPATGIGSTGSNNTGGNDDISGNIGGTDTVGGKHDAGGNVGGTDTAGSSHGTDNTGSGHSNSYGNADSTGDIGSRTSNAGSSMSVTNMAKPVRSGDQEPKTGDSAPLELYATIAMISGFAYLFLEFTDRRCGMTEREKKELVSWLVRWAKQGGKPRRMLALAAIFILLVYYHSIGKKAAVGWKEICS